MKRTGVEKFKPPELSSIAWAGFQEWARQWILLSRRENYEEGTGSHRLWLSIGGSVGHSSLSAVDIEEGCNAAVEGREWDVYIESAADARAEAKRDEQHRKAQQAQAAADDLERALLATLRKFPNGETKSVLRDIVEKRHAMVGAALGSLVQKELVEVCPIKKHTRTEDGYRLTERSKA